MNYKKVIFLSLLLIFAGACTTINNIKSEKPIKNVEIIPVKSENYKTYHGIIKSENTVDLSFQTEGKIDYLPYSKGDYVKKGQVIARLNGILYKIRKNEEQARLQDAVIQYNKAKSYYKRMDILHKEGAISDNDWEEAYFDYKTTAEKIKIQKEKLNYLNEEISFNIISAPFDGFIAEKYTEAGSYAKIGEKIVTIMGNNKTQAEIMVDSDTINKIKLNEGIIAKKDGRTYQGKIKHISKTNRYAGGYLISIALSELIPSLKDGMSIDIYVPINDNSITLIPVNSIFEDDNNKYVYKVVNIKDNTGEIKKEKIETGNIEENEIEVLKGLNSNEYIVADNLEKIKPNTKIKIEN